MLSDEENFGEEDASPKAASPSAAASPRQVANRRNSKWNAVQQAVVGDIVPPGGVVEASASGDGNRQGPGHGTKLVNITREAVTQQEQERREGYDGDLKLWQAAYDGNVREVERWLELGANVAWTMPDSFEESLMYKSRNVSSQAIHAASAALPREARGEEPASDPYKCVETLIKWRADVNAKAETKDGGKERLCEAIHIAAGSGNWRLIKLLVDSRASPEAKATVDGKLHYYPIHDAVWFNQHKSVKALLDQKAKVHARNNEENTALHLAAKLGHTDTVEFLLYNRNHFLTMQDRSAKEGAKSENKGLLRSKNAQGKTALQLAVEKGQFVASKLNLFTNAELLDAETGDRARAFLEVARNCPDAATALLRSEYPDSQHTRNFEESDDVQGDPTLRSIPISDSWKSSIQVAARKGVIKVKDLCELVNSAPQSAVDLLDMLTDKPKAQNQYHRPLPVRANIPVDQEACRLSCVYIKEREWTWDAADTGPPKWQGLLAPQDPKQSQEVTVRVLLLQGVLNSELVHCLAASKDQRIFTKLVVHALLKHLWQSFRPMFLVDLGHQALANLIICYWIWAAQQVHSPKVLRCGLWGIVASEGVSESVTFVCSCVVCYQTLGGRSDKLLWRWVRRSLARAIVGGFAFALAVETSAEFEPIENSSILLSINSLLHWLLILTEIRAFRWTGRRILPIMKSVMPIAGMMVIMASITLAFLHAFWAMDRAGINEISMFNIVVLLFTGEQFLSGEDLQMMPEREKWAVLVLTLGGVWVFLTCTINVFIAVLCECYDQEQERMVCTFLKERARICSGYFLRPKMKATGFSFLSQEMRKLTMWRWIALLAVVFILYGLTLYLVSELGVLTAWLSAIYPSLAVLCVQCILRDCATTNWKESYLWLCHESSVDEETFLAPEQRDDEDSSGRLTRVKKFIRERMKACTQKMQIVQMSVKRMTKEMDDQKKLLTKLNCEVQLACPTWPPDPTQLPPAVKYKPLTMAHAGCPKCGCPEKGQCSASGPPSPSKTRPTTPAGRTGHHEIGPAGKGGGQGGFRQGEELSTLKVLQGAAQPFAQTGCCPQCFSCPRCNEAAGAGAAQSSAELKSLQKEVKSMKESLQAIQADVQQQRDSAKDLKATCEDVKSILNLVISMAQERQERSHRQKRGPASPSAEAPERGPVHRQLPPLATSSGGGPSRHAEAPQSKDLGHRSFVQDPPELLQGGRGPEAPDLGQGGRTNAAQAEQEESDAETSQGV